MILFMYVKSNTISGIVTIAHSVVTTLMALAYFASFPYTWHICVTVDAEGVITARNTMSIIFGASEESAASRLSLIRASAMRGITIILKDEIIYTRLFPKIFLRSIPAKSIPATIILAGPIISPTLERVLFNISGR